MEKLLPELLKTLPERPEACWPKAGTIQIIASDAATKDGANLAEAMDAIRIVRTHDGKHAHEELAVDI